MRCSLLYFQLFQGSSLVHSFENSIFILTGAKYLFKFLKQNRVFSIFEFIWSAILLLFWIRGHFQEFQFPLKIHFSCSRASILLPSTIICGSWGGGGWEFEFVAYFQNYEIGFPIFERNNDGGKAGGSNNISSRGPERGNFYFKKPPLFIWSRAIKGSPIFSLCLPPWSEF